MTIAAIFLALALGILIGVSFGDSFLVANQRDVIQLMEEQMVQLREHNRRQEIELQHWEALRPLLRQNFNGALSEKEIFIISLPGQEGCELRALFEESGAAVTVILVPDAPVEDEETEQLFKGAEDLANLLTMPGEIEAKELIAGGLLLPEAEAAVLQRPPDCCLLLLKPEAFSSGKFFYELWQELQEKGIQVIALFTWAEGESFRYPDELEIGLSLVDNIDTFWGQVALLKMIAENISGHYGFGEGSEGLFPGEVKGN
jgi:hypothetical protein